ncbi:MAG TPA: TolC family protein [Puia sp.]|nr:TolC family protein [Puia sp.]
MYSRLPVATSPFALLLLFVLHGTQVRAQHVQGGRRKTDSLPVYRYAPPTDSIIEIRLVNLALQGPQYEALGHKVAINEAQLSQARRAWFNLLTISLNYNDQTFAKPIPGAAYVYPKYFFGLVIPIGMFFTMGPQIHAASENVKVARNNQEDLARNLRMEVLSKYRTYKNYESLILLQNTVVNDQVAALTQTEKKFRDGIVSIEQYNLANKSVSDEKAKLFNLQLSLDLERLDIERIIGTSLDSVTR